MSMSSTAVHGGDRVDIIDHVQGEGGGARLT